MAIKTSFYTYSYKLKNCWTLGSAADVHIYNDPFRFKFQCTVYKDNTLFSGTTVYSIESYSTVDFIVQIPTDPKTMILIEVALVPGFLTFLVSLQRLTRKGLHWDIQNNLLYYNRETICFTPPLNDYWVLEKNCPSLTAHSFFASSHTQRWDIKDTAARWHTVLDHPGQDAIAHSMPALISLQYCAFISVSQSLGI